MAQPPAGQKFTKLATGENHACGMTPEGAVKCWGGNTWGRRRSPVAGPYKEIAAGDLFTCGSRSPARSIAGATTSTGRRTRPMASGPRSGRAYFFACASNTTTNVWQCWGWNWYGNVPHNKDLPPQQPGPDTDTPVVQIVLTPVEPDGANGTGTLNCAKVDPQASDSSGIKELRCMLDPPYVPASFDTLSLEPCAFLGGKVVGGEGEHTFYVAAVASLGQRQRGRIRQLQVRPDPTQVDLPEGPTVLAGQRPVPGRHLL